ncbi:chromate efflux transporter [Chryseolinea sp. H1M3-3]|uniref:chromate efflux transporter n=1 Tax=Chryseolinea sp. H1M3-3 TaxID=3034144 RepID=UPI0023EC550B|nr:chromate efflux transporter [Chryseolinea sp. H1M3-3]
MNKVKEARPLLEVAEVFFKLGCTAFGGPAVHIAMMEKEVVGKRQWMTKEHFLDLVGATNLIPGPNSTEMTMHCGHERAGFPGLLVAGACFIFPAAILTGVLAWMYRHYGTLPEVQPFVYGIKPAIIAVIVFLMIGLGKKALKTVALGIIGAVAAILVLAGFSEIVVLFGSGAAGILIHTIKQKAKRANSITPIIILAVNHISNAKLFWIFLKIGSVLYGSGYVLFAFLDDALVSQGLLSKQQLVDAIAVGQFTPGPVFSSATFIGWQIGGVKGALAATIGIFLPSFIFVALLNPVIPRLRRSWIMSAFLDAVNIASVAIILAVIIEIGKTTLLDWRTILIACIGFIVAYVFKNLNTAFIILGGSILGYLLTLF